ncbi:MAG: DNA starvation/stationary phase protection protein Dps [Cyanobacteria bacterium SZAS LIN-3]|nr:DNA starvation/stationary phase protection protein Dps [Cyanobacteria bacterium SZAS LIN-3]MBS2006875.1 DNA starvation/stationary phase protection protein Dps [Cyanobacteria bacterium SZAS TMP-1]
MTTATKEAKTYHSKIDLSDDLRKKVVAKLQITLAATADLTSMAKQAHWNVKGSRFYQLHILFDETYNEINEYIDMVAERITALSGYAHGTVRMSAKASPLPEYPDNITCGEKHLEALIERYAIYAKHVREHIDAMTNLGDAGTADMYTEISRAVDKRLWFLEAHLEG